MRQHYCNTSFDCNRCKSSLVDATWCPMTSLSGIHKTASIWKQHYTKWIRKLRENELPYTRRNREICVPGTNLVICDTCTRHCQHPPSTRRAPAPPIHCHLLLHPMLVCSSHSSCTTWPLYDTYTPSRYFRMSLSLQRDDDQMLAAD